MSEWKTGKLHIGKSDKIVTSQKQAVAIALNEAGLSNRQKKQPRSDAEEAPASKLTLKQRISITLKQIIDSVYRDGVDAVLSYLMADNETISGLFRDGSEVYDYTITKDGKISYVEADKRRKDAYLEGYYLTEYVPFTGSTSGYTQGVLQSQLIKLDANKQRACSAGKSCGSSCIAKGLKCIQNLGVKQKAALGNVQKVLSNKKNQQNAALVGAGLLATAAIAGGAIALSNQKSGSKGERGGGKSSAPETSTKTNQSKLSKEAVNKRLEEIENEVVSDKEIAAAKKDLEAEEQIKKGKEAEEALKTKQVEDKAVKKALGFDPEVERELEKLQSAQSEKRAKQVSGQLAKETGRAKSKADIRVNQSGDVDVKQTIEALGIGKLDTPVRNVNEVAQSIRTTVASQLRDEYRKGLDQFVRGHNIAIARSLEGKGLIDKNTREERKSQTRIATAKQVREYNRSFSEVTKKKFQDVDLTLSEFTKEANQSQKYGRSMPKERVGYYQEKFSTADTRSRISSLPKDSAKIVPRNRAKQGSEMTEAQARQIIEGTNNLLGKGKRLRIDSASAVSFEELLINLSSNPTYQFEFWRNLNAKTS